MQGSSQHDSPGASQHQRGGGYQPEVDFTNGDEAVRSVLWGTDINIEDVKLKFKNFLLNFCEQQDLDQPFYLKSLQQIHETEIYTLSIDCQHIFQYSRELYYQLINYPSQAIPIFDLVTTQLYKELLQIPDQIGNYIHILVKTFNLRTVTHIRDLEPNKIQTLIAVRGIVIRCSDIIPDMKIAEFKCVTCAFHVRVNIEKGHIEEPQQCPRCQSKYSFELMHSLSLYNDKQHIKVQETPQSIPEGQVPHTMHLCCYEDLVDSVRPGDRIQVTGIYRASPMRVSKQRRTLKSVYSSYIDVISFVKVFKQRFTHQEEEADFFNEEQVQKFTEISKRPDLYQLLIRSFAPSIWEYDDVKKGLLCQLFGGINQNFQNSGRGRFRGELNVLLVGDPSTAKSQLLQFVHKLSHRGIYTSGKGSSAVGLTVYVKKDPQTREIVLESGALVLSDRGICCIDEFDKMDDNTRAMLHQAMEQQTLSIAKAGIICQLNARTAILAAANPKQSKYNPKMSVVQNIELPPTLLSRFDLIYLILDKTSEQNDRRLSKHILNLFSDEQSEQHPTDLLSKQDLSGYISYARKTCKPILTSHASLKLIHTYVEMRKQGNTRKTITATPRQLESLIRLATALAKMRLDPNILESDIDQALRLMKVATQQAATDPKTGQIDMDLLQTGITTVARLRVQQLLNVIRQVLVQNKEQARKGIRRSRIEEQTKSKLEGGSFQFNEKEFEQAVKSLADEGTITASSSKNPIIRLVAG